MRSKMFIGSSVEKLDLAYAVQENLEHDVEATVWTQGVFALSKTAMASLIDVLDESNFGVFVLAPDDVVAIRDSTVRSVRDNVIFELGLFIGRLGSERCFLIVPRGVDDLHLPSDLLGLTPATYDADRQDANMQASLGPACNRIRKAISKVKGPQEGKIPKPVEPTASALFSNKDDCIALIQSWMGSRAASDNGRAIRFDEVDRDLRLAPGSARKYIAEAARRWGYVPSRVGEQVILFEEGRYSDRL